MSRQIWVALALVPLLVLHQDFWFWDDHRLVLGFLPVGLAWHAGYTLFLSLFWWMVVRYAWPRDAEPSDGES